MTKPSNPPRQRESLKSRTFSKRFVVTLSLYIQPMAAYSMFLNPSTADQVFAIYVSSMLGLAGLYMGVGVADLLTMKKAGLFGVTDVVNALSSRKPHD
jgi:TctA family transporter